MHRRTAETEKAKSVSRFRDGKFLDREKWLARKVGAKNRTVPLEQREGLAEPGERVGTIPRAANIKQAQAAFQQEERHETNQHRAQPEQKAPPAAVALAGRPGGRPPANI
jgi:hypothetical protein